DCKPDRAATDDYRHVEKHVPIPSSTPTQITVATMLGWAMTRPPDGTPRSGRELHVFEIAKGFVQFAGLNPGDCDIHIEVSDSADKTAPRVIVETPGQVPTDNEYCSARQNLQTALMSRGVSVNGAGQEVTPALPADVVGLAFQDFEHNRGTKQVATTWELHPAIVTVH
ncbi:MAG TPA: hypothetical protein VFU86_15175, partial [Terriglobales bacterium]|nr:hypothetical protein [Terriglobales bacterium]